MFAKNGLAATSVRDIAEQAGYTRGAFYSNFDDKLELLLELLRRDQDDAWAKLRATVNEGGTREQIRSRVIACYKRYFHDCDCFPLWVEAKPLACRDIWFQERFNAVRHEELDQVSACIRTFSERDGRPLLLPSDVLALGFVSLRDGAQFLTMCDPQMVSDEVMQTVLAGFFSCVLRRQPEDMPYADHNASVPECGRGRTP